MDRMIKVHSVRHAAPQSNLYTEAAVEEPLTPWEEDKQSMHQVGSVLHSAGWAAPAPADVLDVLSWKEGSCRGPSSLWDLGSTTTVSSVHFIMRL